ncbi:MAG: hypothetical protein LAN63_07665 [Acidobacteriia bacterium]|nr:hypothetical protein [Terriglobia bacterium]
MPQVYMLNLGFTLLAGTSYAPNGSFLPYNGNQSPAPPVLQTSCAWLNYNGSSFPAWATDTCQQLSDAIIGTTWAVKQPDYSPTSTFLGADAGDFVLVRIYTGDGSQQYKLRVGIVFGNGSDAPTQGNVVQSPLNLAAGVARSVIDFPDIGAANYTPSSAGSWVYLLGQLHGSLASYSLNAGATIYDPVSGKTYSLGHDPTLKVVGTVPKVSRVA